MNKRSFSCLTAIITATLVASSDARGNCTPYKSSTDEDMFAVHGCFVEWAKWNARAYNVIDDDWAHRGYYDACNTSLEYYKHWDATYTLAHSNAFARGGFVTQGFHSGLADYVPMTENNTLPWHNPVTHIVEDVLKTGDHYDDGEFSIDPWPWEPNEIKLSCDSYSDADSPESSVAYRSSLLVHEGVHAWEEIAGTHSTHDDIGTDPWFYHRVDAYFGGDLWNQKTGGGTSHSVIQVQVEYLCDLVDNPGADMPLSVRAVAQDRGMSLAANKILNKVNGVSQIGTQVLGFVCGPPDLMAGPPDTSSGCSTMPCSTNHDCDGFGHCLPTHCCSGVE